MPLRDVARGCRLRRAPPSAHVPLPAVWSSLIEGVSEPSAKYRGFACQHRRKNNRELAKYCGTFLFARLETQASRKRSVRVWVGAGSCPGGSGPRGRRGEGGRRGGEEEEGEEEGEKGKPHPSIHALLDNAARHLPNARRSPASGSQDEVHVVHG